MIEFPYDSLEHLACEISVCGGLLPGEALRITQEYAPETIIEFGEFYDTNKLREYKSEQFSFAELLDVYAFFKHNFRISEEDLGRLFVAYGKHAKHYPQDTMYTIVKTCPGMRGKIEYILENAQRKAPEGPLTLPVRALGNRPDQAICQV